MTRSIASALLAAALVACASEGEMSVKAAPGAIPTAPELAQLERFVGTWSGSGEVVATSKQFDEMMKQMPPPKEGEEGMDGTSTAEWALGGKFLQKVGWYEMGGERHHFVEIITWDADKKAFRSWYVSEMGESGEVTMTGEPSGKFVMTGNVVKSDGSSLAAGGTMQLAGDTGQWSWYEDDPTGRTQFKGTTKREGKKVKLPTANGPAPEMAPLAAFVGEWKGTSTMIKPTPAEMTKMMKEQMPDFEGEVSAQSPYEENIDWILGGKCLRKHGWMEMAPGMRNNVIEYITWDPSAKKFHLFSFMDSGDFGEGWITPSADGKSFAMTYEGTMQGEPGTGSVEMTFTGPDTMTWTCTGNCASMGQTEMKGTSHK